MEQPLVSIACITFNQAKYIRQCLDGFVMQKTTFPVEIVIHDDASTDGTQDIIMEYVKKYPQFQWKPILQKENQYSKGKGILVPYVYPECTGKYIALCEGDDYWIDSFKLQKQISVLEQNENVMMVVSDGYIDTILKKDSSRIRPYQQCMTGLIDIHTLLRSKGGLVPTASMCFRREIVNMPEVFRDCPVGDKPLRIWAALQGDVYFIDEAMVFYRINNGVSFRSRVNSNKQYAERIYTHFCRFLDNVNEYTNYVYNEDIQFMKDKEEYYFLRRINDSGTYKCSYLNRKDNGLPRWQKWKTFIAMRINNWRLYISQ